MGRNNWAVRGLSLITAFAMIFTLGFSAPISYAQGSNDEFFITAFHGLNQDIATQYLDFGSPESDIVFPDSLRATVETQKDVLVEVTEDSEEELESQDTDDLGTYESEELEVSEEVIDNVEDTESDTDINEEDFDETEDSIENDLDNVESTESDESTEANESVGEVVDSIEENMESDFTDSNSDEATNDSQSDVTGDDNTESSSPVAFVIDLLFPAINANAAELEDTTSDVDYEKKTVTESSEITITGVTWTLDAGRSTNSSFDSSFEGARYVYVANIPSGYRVNASVPFITVVIGSKPETPAFEASTVVDGVRISIKADAGVFPDGVTLFARRATYDEAQVAEAAVENERDTDKVIENYTFDIKVLDLLGNEIQPDTTKGTVKVSFTLDKVGNQNLDTDVYHITDTNILAPAAERLDTEKANTTVEAETTGFSFYTVEFTYSTRQYVLEGDSEVALNTVLESIGLTGAVSDVTVSDDTLFDALNRDGQWVVVAKQAFTTDEWMKVVLDGIEYEIIVTDDLSYDPVATTGLFAAKFGKHQVFDVQRSPAYPGGTQANPSAFTVSSFKTPYGVATTITDDGWFYFKGIGSASTKNIEYGYGWNCASENIDPYIVELWYNDNHGYDAKCSTGVLGGIAEEGFFYEGDVHYGYYFSNNGGYDYYYSGITYTPDVNGRVVYEVGQLNNYNAHSMLDSGTSYTISFDAGTGTGTMTDVTVSTVSYRLPACTFNAPDGASFSCWQAGSEYYEVGEVANLSGDTTFTAIWSNSPSYIVSFDANGGTGTMTDVTVRSDEYTLPECGFTAPSGKFFTGWSLDTTKYDSGDVITLTGNITLVANWADEFTYTVSFDANGGTGTMNDATLTNVSSYTLPENEFEAPAGKVFEGWKLNQTLYQPGDICTITGNTTFVASWIDRTPVVIGNHGYPYGQNMSSSKIEFVIDVTLTEEVTYRWYVSSDGTDYTAIDSKLGTLTADTTEFTTTFTSSELTNNYWYKVVFNDNENNATEAVQVFKNSYRWYISNGQMAYSIMSNTQFDVIGKYLGTWINKTSYDSYWQYYTSASSDPSAIAVRGTGASSSASFKSNKAYFLQNDYDGSENNSTTGGAHALFFDTTIADSEHAFCFGCDVMINGNDRAPCTGVFTDSGKLSQIQLIDAESIDVATDTDAALVVKTNIDYPDKFYIGYWSNRLAFGFGTASDSGNSSYSHYYAYDSNGHVMQVTGTDSGITTSWTGLAGGATISYGFNLGTVAQTGAVTGEVDYESELLYGLEHNTTYEVTFTNDDGTKETYVIKSDSNGAIKLAGTDENGKEYDLCGKDVVVRKSGSMDDPLEITIAGRPDAEEASDSEDGTFDDDQVDVTEETIKVTIDTTDETKMSQQYRLYDSEGNEIPGQEWISPNADGELEFDGLTKFTTYIIKARTPATNTTPASAPSSGISIKTLGELETEPKDIIIRQTEIIIHVDTTNEEEMAQEYNLLDETGHVIDDENWKSPDENGVVEFNELQSGKPYTIVTRIKETEDKTASDMAEVKKVVTSSPNSGDGRKYYPSIATVIEPTDETMPQLDLEDAQQPENNKTKLRDELTFVDDELGKGNIIDRGNIWGDMSRETKEKLLDKLDESGGEIIRIDDLDNAETVAVKERPIALIMGEGSVIVTMSLVDESRTSAGLVDATAVANSILSEEQLASVLSGSIFEIKVEVTPHDDDTIPQLDRQIIEDAVTSYETDLPYLTIADYIDISLYYRIDDSDWEQITDTDDIEIVIDIPNAYKGLSDDYYIMRAHQGVTTLLEDLDDDVDTITISTGQFSTYALMYNDKSIITETNVSTEIDKACHMHWYIMLFAIIGVVGIYLLRKKRMAVYMIDGVDAAAMLVLALFGSCRLDYMAFCIGIVAIVLISVLTREAAREN